MAVVVAHTYTPVVGVATFERCAGVGELVRSARRYRSGFPNYALFRGCDLHVVTALEHALFCARQFPAESRVTHVDSKGINLILTAQVSHSEWCLASHATSPQQCHQKPSAKGTLFWHETPHFSRALSNSVEAYPSLLSLQEISWAERPGKFGRGSFDGLLRN